MNIKNRFSKQVCFFKDNYICFLMSLTFSIISFGIFIFPHYSQDTYEKIIVDASLSLNEYFKFSVVRQIKGGRYSLGVAKLIIKAIGLYEVSLGVWGNFTAIGLMSINIVYLYNMFKEFFSNKVRIVVFCLSVCVFLCPCFADWFLWSEVALYYFLGVLLSNIGISLLYKNKILKGLLYLFIAIGFYQIILSFFVYFYILILMLKLEKEVREQKKFINIYVRGVMKGILIYVLLAGINILLAKSHPRVSSYSDKFNNLVTVLKTQKHIWMMDTLGRKTYIYLCVFVIALLILGIKILMLTKENKKYVLYGLITIISILGIYLSIFVSHVFVEAWITQRTIVMFYALTPFLLFVCLKVFGEEIGQSMSIIIFILILGLGLTYTIKANNLAMGVIKSNEMDKFIALLIDDKIKRYERENGHVVENIVYVDDESITWSYPDVFCSYDLKIRDWSVKWARNYMFRMYTGRNLKEFKCPEYIYNSVYKEKNWNCYSEEQIYFEGNTVYIGVY